MLICAIFLNPIFCQNWIGLFNPIWSGGGEGGQFIPLSFFCDNSKSICARKLTFLAFLTKTCPTVKAKSCTYCLSHQAYCLNAFFNFTRINLYLDLLPVIGFQHFITFWKVFNKNKQIAQFLPKKNSHIFAQTSLKVICTFLVFPEYTFRF